MAPGGRPRTSAVPLSHDDFNPTERGAFVGVARYDDTGNGLVKARCVYVHMNDRGELIYRIGSYNLDDLPVSGGLDKTHRPIPEAHVAFFEKYKTGLRTEDELEAVFYALKKTNHLPAQITELDEFMERLSDDRIGLLDDTKRRTRAQKLIFTRPPASYDDNGLPTWHVKEYPSETVYYGHNGDRYRLSYIVANVLTLEKRADDKESIDANVLPGVQQTIGESGPQVLEQHRDKERDAELERARYEAYTTSSVLAGRSRKN